MLSNAQKNIVIIHTKYSEIFFLIDILSLMTERGNKGSLQHYIYFKRNNLCFYTIKIKKW